MTEEKGSNITNADIKKLHEATGISTVYLKKQLGMVDIEKVIKEAAAACKNSKPDKKRKAQKKWDLLATKLIEESLNFAEANFLYDTNFIRHCSEPWELVKKKCSDFCLPLIEKARTIDEIKDLLRKAPQESEAYKKAIDKWNELTEEDFKNADTFVEVKKVFENSYNPYYSQSPIIKTVREKFDALIAILIDEAKTQDEAQAAYKFTLFDSDTRERAFEKVLTFINDFYAAKEAFKAAIVDGSNEKHAAFKKCMELGSFYELIIFYREISQQRGSHHYENDLIKRIEAMALESAAATTKLKTIRDINRAFCNHYSDDTKMALKVKWEKLALSEANSITNPEEFKKVFYIFPDDSEARRVALQKMLTFC